MYRYRVVILIVLFGVLPVVAAFFFALSFLGEQEVVPEPEPEPAPPVAEAPPPEPEPPATEPVLAAARALPVGTLIGQGDLEELMLDRAEVHDGHIRETKPDAFYGYAVREALAREAPLARSAVVAPDERGFLAAVLRAGTRAVTIRVEGTPTSQAKLIEPGDRVDVIMTADLQGDGPDRGMFARTIVEDVRLVAVDRRLDDRRPEEEAEQDEDGVLSELEDIVTATLEVTPAQGDRLVLGDRQGSLSLAIRSLAGAGGRAPDAAVELPPGAVATRRTSGPAVDLEDLLLSEYDEERASRLEERLMAEIAASEARLWAAIEEDTRRSTVRIFRGSLPPTEEMVAGGSAGGSSILYLPQDTGPPATPESEAEPEFEPAPGFEPDPSPIR